MVLCSGSFAGTIDRCVEMGRSLQVRLDAETIEGERIKFNDRDPRGTNIPWFRPSLIAPCLTLEALKWWGLAPVSTCPVAFDTSIVFYHASRVRPVRQAIISLLAFINVFS
jgi:hypothetical protein